MLFVLRSSPDSVISRRRCVVLTTALCALWAPTAVAQNATLASAIAGPDAKQQPVAREHGPNASEPAVPALASFSTQDAAIAQEKRFKFSVTPYAWLMGVEGDATIDNQDFDFEREFADIVDDVSFAASIGGSASYDRFVFALSYDFAQIEKSDVSIPGGGSGDFESDFQLLEAAAGYRVDGFSEGQHFDLMVGLRSLELDNTLELSGGGTFEADQSLVDPIFALRSWVPVFPSKVDGLIFNPTIAIGGGGDSDLVYELSPSLLYMIGDSFQARLGYRRVAYQFESGDNELDVSFAGLLIGFGMHF